MNFIAILWLCYFAVGYEVAWKIKRALGPVAPAAPTGKTLGLPELAGILLLIILVTLPVYGCNQARKKGVFLRMGVRMWAIVPIVCTLLGIVAGTCYEF
jgi:hypothetical protein